ncbi:neurogenic locus notch homolog protein 3-like [Phalacrocorax carbo]|uniref:neurogenic locus notch homolog protein 3-like n=1 Tax=Phalacrocorax carbo TaxID=9209 RepID=UPI00311A8304
MAAPPNAAVSPRPPAGDKVPEAPGGVRLLPLAVVGGVILLGAAALGVLVARRRREQSTLWFPEGFALAKESKRDRREPVGQDALGMKTLGKGETLMGEPSEEWPDGDGPEAKRLKVEEGAAEPPEPVDPRRWDPAPPGRGRHPRAPHHGPDAPPGRPRRRLRGRQRPRARRLHPTDAGLLLRRRPGGGGGGGGGGAGGGGASAGVIGALLCQGASLGARTDRLGESALHLAARYARADAAKRLLGAGADANARDRAGRTPLHAAVTADAQGVFQILIRNRSTDLDARTGDGSTALILAARLAVEGMVEELIACHADVNAVDETGKSALHWAAAVNNVEATLALLKNGANKDMQDGKEETPLFLAAREGSYEAAKILLDHFANREITDHLDRLPRDIGRERMHHDIVRLLDEYNTGRSPPGSLPPNPALTPLLVGPPTPFLPGLKAPAVGKKSRRLGGKTGGGKGRGKKLGGECPPGLESSVTLSPVDSLDSPYVPNPTSPGLFPPAPPPILDPPFAVTLGPPMGVGRLSGGPVPPPPRLGLGLGTVTVPFEWRNRVPPGTPCNPALGGVHPVLHPPTPGFAPALLLPHGAVGCPPPAAEPLPRGPQPLSPEEGGPPRSAAPPPFFQARGGVPPGGGGGGGEVFGGPQRAPLSDALPRVPRAVGEPLPPLPL